MCLFAGVGAAGALTVSRLTIICVNMHDIVWAVRTTSRPRGPLLFV
jgi:hypothetical protein